MKPKRIFFARLASSATPLSGPLIWVCASFISAQAGTTWDGGGGDNNWGTLGNWDPDGTPTPNSGTDLTFAGTTRLTSTYNYADGDDFKDVTFGASAGQFIIDPNSGSKGIDWFGNITNNSTNLQTLGINLYLQSGTHSMNATAGSIKINGSIYNNSSTLKITGTSTTSVELKYDTPFGNSGDVNIDSGTLKLGGATFAGTARTYTTASGAVLNINGNTGVAPGTTTLAGGGILLVTDGIFGNEDPNTKSNDRKITINLGSGGLIDIRSSATMINGGWQNTTWTNNLAALKVEGNFDIWDGQTVIVDALSGSGQVTKTSGNSSVDMQVGINNGDGDFTGTFSAGTNGGWRLVKKGTGTQTLSGSTDYNSARAKVENGVLLLNMASSNSVHAIGSGLTVIGGTARLGGSGGDQIFDGSGIVVNGGTFDTNGLSETVTFFNGTGGALTGGGTLKISPSGNDTYSGTIESSTTLHMAGTSEQTLAGTGDNNLSLARVDSGTLTLAKTSSSSVHAIGSGLTVNGGSAKLGGTGADQIHDSAGVTINGGTFDMNSLNETIGYLAGSGGEVIGKRTLTVLTSGSADYSGSIKDSTTLRMAGVGVQTLSGTADNAGGKAQVDSGTLLLAKSSTSAVHAVGASSAVGLTITGGIARLAGTGGDQIYTDTRVEQSGGVFDFNGTNEGFQGLIGSGGIVRNDAASTTSVITLGENSLATDNFTYAGNLENGTGTLALTKVGLGTQTLNGSHTYTGKTTISGGTLNIGAGGFIANTSEFNLGSSGILASINALTIGGSAVQKLSGQGTVKANLTIGASGTHAVGNSPGLQAIEGSLSYAGSSIFSWDLATLTETGRGTSFDAVNVTTGSSTGDLSIDSAAIFRIVLGTSGSESNTFWDVDRSWNVFDAAGITTGAFVNFTIVNSAFTRVNISNTNGSFSFNGSTGSLVWSAVPEPSSTLAGLLLGAGLLRRRRA